MSMKRALIVGLTVLDVVNFCPDYPQEDEDVRILDQRWVKGGNAANTACVLSQDKNTSVELLTCLSGREEQEFVVDQIKNSNVNVENAVIYKEALFPSSICIMNAKTGSRTILHYRENFPDIPASHFEKMDLLKYDWIHFEGRNTEVITSVIANVRKLRKSGKNPIISGEIEKPKRINELLEQLLPVVDVIFISKDIGMALGCNSPGECISEIRSKYAAPSIIICAWGDKGVSACQKTKDGKFSDLYIPAEKIDIIDSLGAGDTFIAATLSKLIHDHSTEESIRFGNKIAARKCTQVGYDNLL